jgi:signal transduction histidine kinase
MPVPGAVDAAGPRAHHNEQVYQSLRARLPVPRPVWRDALLALGFSVAAVVLAYVEHRSGSSPAIEGPLHVSRDPLHPEPPAPDPLAVGEDEPARWTVGVLSLLMTVPLAWRRRLPLAVLAVQFAGVFIVRDITWATFLAVLVGAYSLAAYGRWPLLSLAGLLVAAGLVAVTFPNSTPPLPGWSSPFAILLPIGLFGITIRAARSRAEVSAQRAALLERQQEAATRAAVAEERARIARELHDVVSHHVSVMTIQAGAAGKVIDTRPDLAHQAVDAIESSGREAMGELRHLLGLLAPADHAALRPQPGLDQLDALVDKVRTAGQPVTTRVAAGPLPRGVDLTAYRVVQEALTNALRYAPGADTEIVVERDGEVLIVEVTDDGVGPVGGPGVLGAGSGLLGLAERLKLYHGTLEAGRRLGGGFRVRARIPLEPVS